ncbi:MAG: CDGSH iron-sulfur domain-containing protein, partial [Gemmatimonadetes bacterium]|nr:CDGSH iron-sulfur domain-containing protein [Gemmatimonadota bacterium]
ISPRGPVYVRGDITVKDHTGAVLRTDTRLALCRCGHSSHKPFCDGTHRTIGFSDPGVPLGSREKGA